MCIIEERTEENSLVPLNPVDELSEMYPHTIKNLPIYPSLPTPYIQKLYGKIRKAKTREEKNSLLMELNQQYGSIRVPMYDPELTLKISEDAREIADRLFDRVLEHEAVTAIEEEFRND